MSGQRQPIGLIMAKNAKHLTKEEIAERMNTEVHAPSDKVKPPSWLDSKQKAAFRRIADELAGLDLISNLDCEALARLIVAQTHYTEITKQLADTPLMVTRKFPTGGKDENGADILEERTVVNEERERRMVMQERAFRECRQSASDFGLTVSSRCRLVVPKPQQQARNNKFDKFNRNAVG